MNDGMGSGTGDGDDWQPPQLRVVRGNPTAEELAALVAAVGTRRPAGRTTSRSESAVSARSGWVGITRPGVTAAGLPIERGPHAWRISTFPR